MPYWGDLTEWAGILNYTDRDDDSDWHTERWAVYQASLYTTKSRAQFNWHDFLKLIRSA